MKRIRARKTKISAAWLAMFVLLFFSSCSVYRNGFIRLPANHAAKVDLPDSLFLQKEKLCTETKELTATFSGVPECSWQVSPLLINRIFENLQAHYQIDSAFQKVLISSPSDSVKQISRKKLLESAATYQTCFQNNKKLRRMINHGDEAFGIGKKTLLHSQKFFWASNNKMLREQIMSEQSKQQSKCMFLTQKHGDNCYGTWYKTIGGASEVFSRIIAMMHAKPHPEQNTGRLMPYLKKWDIIIQKSPRRLTDKFIPGFFGHAAIYMGDSLFVEGIQKGIIISNPKHFAEGNSFLVIRMNEISPAQEKRIKQLIQGQIGKKYDYNFNAGYPDKLTCTELVFFVFDQVLWQRKKTMGICTMYPDLLVKSILNNPAFSFPLFFDEYHLIENPETSFIRDLLTHN